MYLADLRHYRFGILLIFLLFFIPTALFAASCPDDIVGYWQLNTSSAYEDSIAGNDGDCAGACPSVYSSGAVNAALTFNGSTTGLSVPASADYDWSAGDSFSIEMWVRRTTTSVNSGGEVLVSRVDPDTALQWRVEIRTVTGTGACAAFVLADTAGTGAGSAAIGTTKPITINRWHHIVAIRDAAANTNVLYVDGEIAGQTQNLSYSAGFGSDTADLNIGWNVGTNERHLNGYLDEVAVYNRALTEKEIQSHYYLSRGYCVELDSPIRIMPMGNSITKDRYGVSDPRPVTERPGYRGQLYSNLSSNDYYVDFIGSESDGDPNVFDTNHVGWGGIRTSHVLSLLQSSSFTSPDEGVGTVVPSGTTEGTPYLNFYPTDIILLHIGTNDISAYENGQMTSLDIPISNLNEILDQIDSANERTTVVLARIINRAPGGIHAATSQYNDLIGDLVADRTLAGDKIVVVNMEDDAGLDYIIDSDFHDNLHPNATGYPKMGDQWFDVLDTFLPQYMAPTITSNPIETAGKDQLYSYQVTVSGTGPFSFSLIGDSPDDMTIDATTGLIQWTPTESGSYNVTVQVTNALPYNQTGTVEHSFSIEIDAQPVGTADTYALTDCSTLDISAAQGVLANDTDDDAGDSLQAVLVQAPAYGDLDLNADGSFTYTPRSCDPLTADLFTYVATDGKTESETVTVTLSTGSTGDAPVITGQAELTTYINTPITVTLDHLTVDDPFGRYPDGFTLTIYEGTNYTLSGTTVTPDSGFIGTLSIPVMVNDGSTNSNGYTLAIDVLAEGAPIITGQATLKTNKNKAITITLDDLTVDDPSGSYPDGFTLSLAAGENFTVSDQTVTPGSGFSGTLSVPAKVSNGTLDSNTYTLTVTVADSGASGGGGGGGGGCFIDTALVPATDAGSLKTVSVCIGLFFLSLVILYRRRVFK